MERPIITHTDISVSAKNREVLIGNIQKMIYDFSGRFYVSHPYNEKHFFISLVRKDCGCKYEYKEIKDIPSTTLFCKHGNQIIRYTDEEILN